MVPAKKLKHKRDFHKSENDSEELKTVCEIGEQNGINRKKYLVFKLQKNVKFFKWELGTFFFY